MVCRFFGHKDAPASIAPALENDIKYLIQERDVDEFLIGNHGNFDSMAYCVLKGSITNHPHITFHVVLAYMPKESAEPSFYEYWGPPCLKKLKKCRRRSQSHGVISGWFVRLISVFTM